jgi:ADP-ribose pyrophosphatase
LTRFRVTGSRVLHAGPVTSLVSLEVDGPDGEHFEREVLRHPGAACVVPVLDDGTVVLVRQYRAAVDEDLLELPAGLLDVEGEPPIDCARRELIEEAGYDAANVEHLTTYYASPGCSDEQVHIFLATGLRAVPLDRGGHEEAHMTVEHVALADTAAMVTDGRIKNAAAVVGLTLARERFNRP